MAGKIENNYTALMSHELRLGNGTNMENSLQGRILESANNVKAAVTMKRKGSRLVVSLGKDANAEIIAENGDVWLRWFNGAASLHYRHIADTTAEVSKAVRYLIIQYAATAHVVVIPS